MTIKHLHAEPASLCAFFTCGHRKTPSLSYAMQKWSQTCCSLRVVNRRIVPAISCGQALCNCGGVDCSERAIIEMRPSKFTFLSYIRPKCRGLPSDLLAKIICNSSKQVVGWITFFITTSSCFCCLLMTQMVFRYTFVARAHELLLQNHVVYIMCCRNSTCSG